MVETGSHYSPSESEIEAAKHVGEGALDKLNAKMKKANALSLDARAEAARRLAGDETTEYLKNHPREKRKTDKLEGVE